MLFYMIIPNKNQIFYEIRICYNNLRFAILIKYQYRTMNSFTSRQNSNDRFTQTNRGSLTNLLSNSSNSKFVIRYQQRETSAVRSNHKINRYSSKNENELIKQKKINDSFVSKMKSKSKDGSSLPSYLRPTQASISAQLQKQRTSSLADVNENKNNLIRLKSKSLQQDEEGERQYNRIPIQFYDEKTNGCGADSIRARVVFRGYAPKNTYFYLKTLKPYKRKPKKSNSIIINSTCSPQDLQKNQNSGNLGLNQKNQYEIRFESKFESGNLSAASRITQYQYWLYMREDTNTHGLRQWYYFIACNRKPIKVKFRIYKFTKYYSLYRMGMKPFIRTMLNDTIIQWHQGGEKIKYDYDNQQKCFYLQFEYKFEQQNQQVEFSMLPPYTYSMLKDYIHALMIKQNEGEVQQKLPNLSHLKSEENDQLNQMKMIKKAKKVQIQNTVIGQTLAGLDIFMIKIWKLKEGDNSDKNRDAIIILARTHPGETVSNFSLENFINTIIFSQEIIQFYDFFIVPMVNPDGVYFGNHRTSIIGQDINRNFNNNDFQVFPEVETVHSCVNLVRKNYKIKFLIDLHGHSARKNIFAYGDEYQINTPAYLHTRILPKLLNDSISSFKYDFCVFRESKQKKNTARVYYSSKYKFNCLTFQQSYGIVDEGATGVHTWRNFGTALAQCLLEYAKMYKIGQESTLEEYLSDQIAKDKVQLEKRIMKHKKMLGIFTENIQSMKTPCLDQSLKQSQLQIKQHGYSQPIVRQNPNYSDDKEDQANQIKEIDNKSQDQKSVALSQLSSGQESLEMMNQQIEGIKKEFLKVGCFKEGIKREKYNIADTKLQLFEYSKKQSDNENGSYRRMHEQKSSMIPRIAKLQLKRKEEYNMSFKRQFKEDRRDLFEKQRQERRRQIQAKFKRMGLPSIKK